MPRSNTLQPYILNFAPTGMVPTKALNPNTPISIAEIVDDVLHAAELGASIAHIHARDQSTGAPIVCPDIYGSIIANIRAVDKTIIICVSLSGRNVSDPSLRAAPLMLDGEVKPDMGSLTLSSLNFAKQPSINAPTTIEYLADAMQKRGIFPELEVFDLGMSNYIAVLQKKRLLPLRLYGNILLGNIFGAQPNFSHLAALTAGLPRGMQTSVAGLGDYQLTANVLGLASGLGIRVGLEDNLWQDRTRQTLASNRTLLQRVSAIASHMELSPLPPAALRKRLGLAPGSGHYGYATESQISVEAL